MGGTHPGRKARNVRHRKKKDRSRLRAQLYRIYRWSAPLVGAVLVALLRWWLEVRYKL